MTSKPGAKGDIIVVHSSDLHVDDEFTARSHGGDGNAGVRAVMATARAVKADLVLLAGDVFEHNRLGEDILETTARLVADAGMPVVILPGNHDPAMADSAFYRGALAEPKNLHVLGVTHEDAVSFAALDLEVWGRAHRDYIDMAPLQNPRARAARWHIAIAHGHYHVDAANMKRPRPAWLISDDEIAATQADYVALGHWNQAIRVGTGPIPAYYSGSPEFAGTVNLIRFNANGEVSVEREAIRWE
jgi:DNA repair exonuclease SbcCD nuclease subunit